MSAQFYVMKEILTSAKLEDCKDTQYGYVAVMSHSEFEKYNEKLGFGIDVDFTVFDENAEVFVTKAEVNYDSLTGSFAILNREHLEEENYGFHFALDEKGIVFIDDSGYAKEALARIQKTKKWRSPSLERFIFDFLEDITRQDLAILMKYEKEMDSIEEQILHGETNGIIKRVMEIRSDIQEYRIHYEQLQDLCQELIENENHFFKEEEMRYFRNYFDRTTRLKDIIVSLREYTMHLRDLYNYSQDEKQNRLMSVLTVVATIFMPLTLMTGWYGMNFVHMPELDEPMAYGVFIIVCILVVLANVIFFKRKKWL